MTDAPRRQTAPLRGYRLDIQVLRAIAVILVVLYHGGHILTGGYVGVDVFFVISGFVIGRLLVTELDGSDRISLPRFSGRRVRRIMPPLAVMLVVVVLLAPFLAPIGASSTTPMTAIAAALISANLYLYRATAVGYFGAAAETNPLLHTWSLSVEEQYYLVIPLVLFLTWRVARSWGRTYQGLRVLIAATIAVSFAFSVVATSSQMIWRFDGQRFAFFMLFTRAWEFAIGVALVLLPPRWHPPLAGRRVLAAVGLVAIAVAGVTFTDATPFPGWAALLPVLGAAAVVLGGTDPDGVEQAGTPWLRWGPLVWIGAVSYSWYLWHWPAIVFTGAMFPGSNRVILLLAGVVSLLPAWASYQLIEQRMRKRTNDSGWVTLRLAAVCVAVPVVLGVMSVPLRTRVDARAQSSTFAAGLRNHIGRRSGCHSAVPLGERDPSTCRWGTPGGTSVQLIGDSYADQMSEAFIEAAQRDGLDLRIASSSGCSFVDLIRAVDGVRQRRCRNFITGSLDQLVAHPPDVVVIANATTHLDESATFIDPVTGRRSSTTAARTAAYETAMVRTIERLRAAGSKVALIEAPPRPPTGWDPRNCSNALVAVRPKGCTFPTYAPSTADYLIASGSAERAIGKRAAAPVWSFVGQVCPGDRCAAWLDGHLVWRDGSHISVPMSKALGPTAADDIQRLHAGT